MLKNKYPKLIINLQLFAEKGEDAETTEPQSDNEYLFSQKEDETPDWLKDDDENVEEEEKDEDTEEVEEEETPEEVKQSDKANSAFADLRRQKKELEQQTKAADKWAVDNFADLGVTDFKSYQAMMDKQIMEQTQSELEEKGYDVELIHKALKLDPKYKAIIDAQPQQEPQKKEEEQQIDTDKLVADYTLLQEKYPEFVTKPEEVPQEVWDRYDRGYDLVEAFEIVNKDKLSQKIAKKTKEMTRQETLNKLNSKKHLKTEKESGGGADDVFIDKETMAMYKDMGFKEKQAIKFHKQHMK